MTHEELSKKGLQKCLSAGSGCTLSVPTITGCLMKLGIQRKKLQKKSVEGGEMTHWLKCLPHVHEIGNSDP